MRPLRFIVLGAGAVVAGIVLSAVLIIALSHISAHAGSVIPAESPMSRHWCRHHPTRCKRQVNHAGYRSLRLDGRKVPSKGGMPGPKHLQALIRAKDGIGDYGCPKGSLGEQRSFSKSFGGMNHIGDPVLQEWRQYLDVMWCFDGRHITRHYAASGVDHIGWVARHVSDHRTSQWYPWQDRFIHHHGRFEAIDSTMQECVFLFNLGCVLEDHPMLHIHEHADGGFTYNSRRV